MRAGFFIIINEDMEGWIKLHRSSLDHWLYNENRPLTKREAWENIIIWANYKTSNMLINGQLIECKRGQLLYSIKTYSIKFKWSVDKVRSFFELLKKDDMISIEGLKYTTRLTVCNYDIYQEVTPNSPRTEMDEDNENFKNEFENNMPADSYNTELNNSIKEDYNELNNDISRTDPELIPNSPRTDPELIPNSPRQDKNIKKVKNIKNNIYIYSGEKNWKIDFEIYLTDLRESWKEIVTEEYIKDREKYHPGVDIKLSLEKSCLDFWATELGWKNKKSKKISTINWKSTFNRSLSQTINQVKKQKSFTPNIF